MTDWDNIKRFIMEVDPERRRRIRVAVAAYAYEIENDPIMSDVSYDELARSIDPRIETGHDVLDEFFRTEFTPATGQWVHNHPDIEGLRNIYHRIHGGKKLYNTGLFGP